jgi:hypothetical protein
MAWGTMKIRRGKKIHNHTYLGGLLTFLQNGQRQTTMCDYLDRILETYDLAMVMDT